MNPEEQQPTLYVFAGPNGAGKSAYFQKLAERLPGIQQINADVTAAKNPHLGAMGVGAIMARESQELTRKRESFSWETNLAKQSNYKVFQGYQEKGYRLDVTYVNVQSVELAKNRVAQRVAAGGHPIPEKQIEERYTAGLELIKQNYQVPDRLELVDNSGKEHRTVVVVEKGKIIQQAEQLPKWAADITTHINRINRIEHMERQETTTPAPVSPKEQFKEAATHVAGELKATGQPADALAAARLQEVSRFVDRVPYIGGLNKENVDKALTAADRIPTLANSPQVEQLRTATTALSQPGVEQQAGVAQKEKATSRDQGQPERGAAPAGPTPDQARETYLKNVGPVAQGLKENGEGLNAARLQEVAKFIERTPYVGGINKENVDKALNAADRVPSLSSSKELGELKGAVGVMSQPTQQRSNPGAGRDSGGIER